MRAQLVNLAEKLALFSDHWSPRIIAQVNDFHVKLAKVQGEFVWHTHDDEDEMFLVISGELTIKMRDGDVRLAPGELFVVTKGAEHCPVAAEETAVLVLERASTAHTGSSQRSEMTVDEQEWI
jgi:mannose-6-phosphate isomerase-like protein (cupin superfamily)